MRGPLVETLNGNRYIGLAVCALTKYTESAGKTIQILKLMEICGIIIIHPYTLTLIR